MSLIWLLSFLSLCCGTFPLGFGKNISSRPSVVNIGAIFSLDSTIGKVSKIAIVEAVKDVNADPGILPGTNLWLQMQNSNCSGFLGMVEGNPLSLSFFAFSAFFLPHFIALVL